MFRRLLLVRHGLPDFGSRKRRDEPPGPPLTPTGFRQAAQAAAIVAKLEPQAIHTSPLARARQTAQVIARACGLSAPSACRKAAMAVSEFFSWARTTPRLFQAS